MTEWTEQLIAYWWLPVVAVPVILGFCPRVLIHLIVLIYPKGDLRRQEYVAEMCVIPYHHRLVWIADQVGLALMTGLPLRVRAVSKRIRPEPPSDTGTESPQPLGTADNLTGRSAAAFAAYRAGDRQQLGVLVDLLTPGLWQTARAQGLSKASAEDVVQTAWLRLIDRADGIESPLLVLAWMVTTVRRESFRHHRLMATEKGGTTD